MRDTDATERFSSKAADYARYRPGYPSELLGYLRTVCGLIPSHVIADVGSGTGKLTELLLANGNAVYAVEPNREMRGCAERLLGGTRGFRSVDGRAEETTLPDGSIDVVAVGQAFHWFDPARALLEFRRVLRPGGLVVLVWNVRHEDASPFLGAYEGFLRRYSCGYQTVHHRRLTEGDGLRSFFSGDYAAAGFPNPRLLNFEQLLGGYRSTSYALAPDHPRFDEAAARLKALFDAYEEGGMVSIPLVTEVHHGRV